MTRILGLAGSLRRQSYNRQLLRQLAAVRPSDVDWQEWDDLAAVPPFNEDDEPIPPEGVRALRAAMTEADGLLIATPEYNGSIPGQLKNVVDWVSRPHGSGVLAEMPVAVVGASPSRYGAIRAQAELRTVLHNAGAQVLDREVPITRAHEEFTAGGQLTDPMRIQQLRQTLKDLAAMAETDTPVMGKEQTGDVDRRDPHARVAYVD